MRGADGDEAVWRWGGWDFKLIDGGGGPNSDKFVP